MKYINGLAKSGNNALAKACGLLGVPMQVQHIPYPEKPDGDCLFIVRHPKDILCAAVRSQRMWATPASVTRAIQEGVLGRPLRECVELFGPWTKGTTIRYEDLIASDAGMRFIANWLGVPYNDTFDQLPGGTATWTGRHQPWAICWSYQAQAAWEANGGLEFEAAYGY